MFMGYLVLKKWRNYEWRLYPENSDIEGEIIYKGHKFGLENSILSEILEIKVINKNNFEILKYDESDTSNFLKKKWIKTNKDNFMKDIFHSWNTALAKLGSENQNFKKIIITKIFI